MIITGGVSFTKIFKERMHGWMDYKLYYFTFFVQILEVLKSHNIKLPLIQEENQWLCLSLNGVLNQMMD